MHPGGFYSVVRSRRQLPKASTGRERMNLYTSSIYPTANSHFLFPVPSRCDLLRRLTGLRLRSLRSDMVKLTVNVFASFSELIHALSQASRQVRQFFSPEEDKNDEEDYK
jgi:hypothetical protein